MHEKAPTWYGNGIDSNALEFHSDQGATDLIALLSISAAQEGGESLLVSTIAIHNELLRRGRKVGRDVTIWSSIMMPQCCLNCAMMCGGVEKEELGGGHLERERKHCFGSAVASLTPVLSRHRRTPTVLCAPNHICSRCSWANCTRFYNCSYMFVSAPVHT